MSSSSVIDLFLDASVIVQSVIILLLLASLFSWMIIFERWIYMKKSEQDFVDFEDLFWSDLGLEKVLGMTQQEGNVPLGAECIFLTCSLDYKKLISQSLEREVVMESVQRSMRVALVREEIILEKHLPFLATVASASPYVGLFGTVWGIMNSFQSIAISRNTSLAIVAPGIAEALFATALGLLAAIPAVVAYNKFNSDSKKYSQKLESFSKRFTAII